MSYLNDEILESLKRARKAKGLSQRELSAKSGVPQSHISKIENGAVDLRVSSLVALARTLDLELELIPRKTVPAVQSIVRKTINADFMNTQKRVQVKPAYSLDDEVDDE
ncbi:helix-turn-helix transcriptional regulator [Cardiobacterium sp. AH-315-I02]|nr:helix-turn-helix transcriptional regulator [Cardiobacterium sp. AH-315-I02]